jgi:micrococcal nuclease
MPRPHSILAVLVAAVAALVAGACGSVAPGDPTTGAVPPGTAVVARVIDGDTFVAQLGGEPEHVRLIGIDTPETKRPGAPVECFGTEASAALSELLPAGTTVRLERDVEDRDRYGRLLAYVHRVPDGLFVNEAMAAGGFAAASAIPPNTTRTGEMADAAQAARTTGAGLWGRCGGAHEPVPP